MAVTACGVPQNSIEVKTAREAAAANCDGTGKCVKDPSGLVLYNSNLVTENFVLKRSDANQTLLTKLINLIDEPKLLVTADKLEPLMRGVAIVGEFEPCDSPRGIDGANPTAGQLRALKQGRYKACITYIGDGLLRRAYSLAPIDVDTTPPEIDGNGVAHSNLTPISANLSWAKAGDNLTLDGKLLYKIYTSTIQPMNSLEAVRLYGSLSSGRMLGGTGYVISGLSEIRTYHAAVVVADEAGNESLVGSTTFQTPAADNQPPSLTISSAAQAITSFNPVPVTINFSELVSGFEASDIFVAGGTVQNFTGSNAIYTFDIVPASDGQITVNVNSGVARDSAGNGNLPATQFSVVYDSTPPVEPLILDPAKYFNASFTTTISQGLPADANFKEFRYTTNGTDPTCSTGTTATSQSKNVTIPASTTTLKAISCDHAGQGSPVAAVTYTYDNALPTVSITSNRDPGPTNNSSILLTFTFSEAVTGFDATDVAVTNATKGTFTAISATTYTLAIMPTDSAVSASVAANSAIDSASNGNLTSTPWSITYDNSAPTVAITSNRDPGPTNNSSILLTFTFSEAVTGFDASDVTVANATKGTFTASSATVYTLALTATGSAVSASVAANSAIDSAANGNVASTPWSITYDNSAPTVAITSDRDPGPTNNSAITLTFTFSEAVTGFTASDVALTNATAGTFTATSSTVYTLAITATGTNVTANVAANMANDTAGNGNTAATQWSITYDNSNPTVAITSSPASGPTNNAAMTLTFTFSEGVTGFTSSDVDLTNATKGTFTATSATVYTLAITATGSAVTANIAANAVIDSASNGNTAATQWSITYDDVAPIITLASVTTPSPGQTLTPEVAFTSNESGSVRLYSVAGCTSGEISDSAAMVVGPNTQTASYVIENATTTIYAKTTDAVGNSSCTLMGSYTNDTIPPELLVASDAGPGPTTTKGYITFTLTLSEPPAIPCNVSFINIAASGDFIQVSPTQYTVSVYPGAGIFVVQFYSCTDAAGNEGYTNWIGNFQNTAPLAPVISDASKSYNSSFTTLIQENIVPDDNFNYFQYTLDGTDPDPASCDGGVPSPINRQISVEISADSNSDVVLKVISCDVAGAASAISTATYTFDDVPPDAPTVTGATPTGNAMPTWTWSSGGGGGNGTYRYKLNNADFSTGATETTNTSFTPGSALSEATHILYVQERDAAGNWSEYGSFEIQVITPPTAPTLSAPIRQLNSLRLSWASVTGATSYNLYWSTAAGVTVASNKISNVVSVYTHTPLTGGTPYYYKLAAVKNGVEGALSNEVNAAPYSYAAPTVSAISPNSGSTNGGTTVTITGTGFVSGATVSIGGTNATSATFVSPTSLTATTPSGSSGAQNVVVTNPDGQIGTLVGGFTYIAPACSGDCYLEGSSPNFAQDLAVGTERQGPSSGILTLQFANGSSGFKIWKEKGGSRILNASGIVANGWQQTLARSGTAFSGSNLTDVTYVSQIAGRVCPTNVFVSHSEMTATGRCLYYDSANSNQTLDVAGTGLTEASDWLQNWNRAATGRGTGSSYFEGNIKSCADKGMRLPTIYETTLDQSASFLPTGDSGVNPTWAGATNGVPGSGSTGRYWTASASTSASDTYWIWVGTTITTGSYSNNYLGNFAFRCVLPSNVATCNGDCYLEGTAPNYAQALAIGAERQGPSGTTLTLQYASGTSGFKIWREKGGTRILNATGLVSNGWQQTLTRAGTAFTGASLTNSTHISQIAGRACPPNVFLDYSNMTATNRCLYYDVGTGLLTLDGAGTTGVEAQDWLQVWDSAATGRGTLSSYYEGNIKTCADKGMRLPLAYETAMNNPGTTNTPTGDTGVAPTWASSAGVPNAASVGSGWTWTASANRTGNGYYWVWVSSTNFNTQTYNATGRAVRCVLP